MRNNMTYTPNIRMNNSKQVEARLHCRGKCKDLLLPSLKGA